MSIQVKYYFGVTGQTSVTDAELAFVEILCVTRNGTTYYKTSGTPAANTPFFQYDMSGKINFDPTNPFTYNTDINGYPISSIYRYERVSVKFKA